VLFASAAAGNCRVALQVWANLSSPHLLPARSLCYAVRSGR
jgi:hypothetical protein